MTATEQYAALVALHDRLVTALMAIPRGAVHPAHVLGTLVDLLACTIVDTAQAAQVGSVTDEFVTMLRARVAHYVRKAAREQGEFAWPAPQERGRLQ